MADQELLMKFRDIICFAEAYADNFYLPEGLLSVREYNPVKIKIESDEFLKKYKQLEGIDDS